ncbi:MAG: glycerophosphoryl diester phosphodiesterase membrane domain-containing protein [Candidatus Uhrbacteria bacterium]|nr:glycerophosphoryl diester phosphodiesterase membrane domain-containing protein [Patescibacteria group bacterium]MBU1907066.1 glycerophosphoryl diester phosphodiesterase membrane domain-containing protein [Patescibacteria group bacterium]
MPGGLITVGQIIDHAWDHYRKHFVELISVSAWLLILAVLYTIAFALYPSAADFYFNYDFTAVENFAITLAMITSFIVGPILGIWIFASLVKLVAKQAQGAPINLKKVMHGSWKHFWPLVLVNVLFTLLIMAPILLLAPGLLLTIFSISATSGTMGSLGSLLIIAGIIAAIVVVIWLAVKYFFIGYTVVLDERHGKAAFSASSKLVKGRFWPLLGRLLVPKVLFFLLGAIIQIVLIFVITALITAFAGLNLDLAERLLSITNSVVLIIVTILINPIIIIADYLIYDSAK